MVIFSTPAVVGKHAIGLMTQVYGIRSCGHQGNCGIWLSGVSEREGGREEVAVTKV